MTTRVEVPDKDDPQLIHVYTVETESYFGTVQLLQELDNHPIYNSKHDRQFLQNIVCQGFISKKQSIYVPKIRQRIESAYYWKPKSKLTGDSDVRPT